MTQVTVTAGICGFETRIQATDNGGYTAVLNIESMCPNWRKVSEKLGDTPIPVMGELFKNKQTGKLESKVLKTALETIPHVSCPVISGTLKALEVSVGLALPADVAITFQKEEA